MTSRQDILQESYQLIDGIRNWNKDKCYTYPTIAVQTYHKTIDGKYWCGRSNTLQDDDSNQWYQKFLKYLIGIDENGILQKLNHTKHEGEYIHSLKSYQELDNDDPIKKEEGFVLVQLLYDIGPIFKKREFIEYILIQSPIDHSIYKPNNNNNPDEEVSLIISVPEDLTHRKNIIDNTVRATYESIERVIYNKVTREIQWDMITSSDAKGCLPMWLQKTGINKSISLDVPSFLEYISQNIV